MAENTLYSAAIADEKVSFDLLVEVEYGRRPGFGRDADLAQFESYHADCYRVFQKQHGAIVHSCFFEHEIMAVAMTEDGELHWCDPPFLTTDEVYLVLLDVKGLYRDAQALLPEKDFNRCCELLYEIICGVYAVLDVETNAKNDVRHQQQLVASGRLHRLQFEQARQFFERAVQRKTQLTYFVGMVSGLLPLALFAAFLMVVLWNLFNETTSLYVTGVFFAGGVGAIVSVLTRMAKGNLALDHNAGDTTVRLLGGCRPVIGAIFGVVIFALVKSTLAPLTLPANAEAIPYFFLVLAFFSGFSERWAQDMLSVVENRTRSIVSLPSPVVPNPVIPNPVNPNPVNPNLVNPNPVNPDPENPDPVSPNPVIPNPVNPAPVNPDPVNPAPDPSKP
jgi:hypothetical protein